MKDRLIEALGWYGTCAILLAFAATSFDWMEPVRTYQVLNATGAFGVGVVCWKRKTWQPFWLEVVWGSVALIALARTF